MYFLLPISVRTLASSLCQLQDTETLMETDQYCSWCSSLWYLTSWFVRYRIWKDMMFNYPADTRKENSRVQSSSWRIQASDISLKGNKWAREVWSEKSNHIPETKSCRFWRNCEKLNLQNKRTCEWLYCE